MHNLPLLISIAVASVTAFAGGLLAADCGLPARRQDDRPVYCIQSLSHIRIAWWRPKSWRLYTLVAKLSISWPRS